MRALIAAASAAFLLSAGAQANDFYVQGDLGATYYGDNDLDGNRFDIQSGLSGAIRVGTTVIGLRGEAEVGYTSSDVELQVGEIDYSELSFTAAIHKDFAPFYVGGGGGFAYQELSAEIFGREVSDDETNFTLHGEAGVTIETGSQIAIVPHYRLTYLPGFELDDEVLVHSVRLGLRWSP